MRRSLESGCPPGTRKEDVRRGIRLAWTRVDESWIREQSARAQERVVALPEFAQARRVGCYLAMAREVQTDWILARCWRDGKAVCVPAHRAEDGRYAMAALAPDAARGAGPAGIVEPAFKEWILLETVDLVVVPGVAFDPAGGRVGRGAGHYDRLLAGAGRACARVGLAFEFQVLAGVPTSGHDVGMDVIVTEQRTLRRTACAGQERNV
jgi:5-formyltetrahydrofolate cyclo-ligase